ncbi:MAG TPA: YciI family protein [Terriglobales bacterium]|nr:YciI family protein [Terriglobales bacterium]
MRYMLLIYGEEKEWEAKSEQERDAAYQACVSHSEARRPSGFYQGGERLEPTRSATTVRMKDGRAIMTDGPFAETKEQLAGYTILDARDLDEALAFVARHPLVRAGFSIEVRPFRVGKPT